MDASADRPEFEPPPQPALIGGLVLAVLAHLMLAAALAWGVRWQRQVENVQVEAELWATLPQPAAQMEEPPAPPPPAPAPVVAPAPPPPPAVKAETPPPPPRPSEAQIAVEREKERRAEAQHQAALEEQRKEKERARRLQEEREEKEREAKLREKEKLAAERKRQDEADRRKEQLADRDRARARDDQMRRMQQMANAGRDAPSASSEAVARGPSADWAGRVRARVRPNIVFGDVGTGNPVAEVEVRLAPDGTITAKRLTKSSGVKAWDDAVLRALDKTEVLPRDTDGTVPSPVTLSFRPRD